MQISSLTVPKLAPMVVDAALRCVQAFGRKEKHSWAKHAVFAVLGTIEITYEVPDTLTKIPRYQMQIWKDRKSVMIVTWEQDLSGPYKALKLVKGPWVDEVLDAANLAVHRT